MNMNFHKKLPNPQEVKQEHPVTDRMIKVKEKRDAEIKEVFDGTSSKFLLIIGPYIWGLFSKKITKIGAYSGIVSGLLVVGVSTLVISLHSGFSAAAAKSPEMGVAAMAVSLLIVPLVSVFTKNQDTQRVEEIFTCYHED